MKRGAKMVWLASFLLMAACTSLNYPPPTLGMAEQDLIAKSGKPRQQYQDGNTRILEYSSVWGQYTYMARIGPDGRLMSWEQVLTTEKFAAVRVGQTTKRQVLLMFGTPAEESYLPLRAMEVWSYRYKEGGVWNSLMHVHFDREGVVRQMLNGPDPAYEGRSRR